MKKIVIIVTLTVLFILGLSVLIIHSLGEIVAPTPPQDLETAPYVTNSVNIDLERIEQEDIHTGEGVKVIGEAETSPQILVVDTPDTVWENDNTVTYNSFTLPEMTELSDGAIGKLSIPELELVVDVFESDDEMEDMENGVAHFKSTSAWDGNIGLSAHNINFDGSDGYFKNLHTLTTGSRIIYETAIGVREYEVITIKSIDETDWSYLEHSNEHKITLITCISGQPTKRLVVQAVLV